MTKNIFQKKMEYLIEQMNTLIDTMPDRGLKCEQSQKVCLKQAVFEVEKNVNGVKDEDFEVPDVNIILKEPERSIVLHEQKHELVRYLIKEKEEAEKFIIERAKEYNCENEEIFDLDFRPGFDEDDFANHNFDLGKWYTCKETLELIEKKNFCKNE